MSGDSKLDEALNKSLKWIDEKPEDDRLVPSNPNNYRPSITEKLKENPFVPLGLLATVGCLTLGLRSMTKGDSVKQQFFMRGRVLFQGLTLVAMLFGIVKFERKKLEKKKQQ